MTHLIFGHGTNRIMNRDPVPKQTPEIACAQFGKDMEAEIAHGGWNTFYTSMTIRTMLVFTRRNLTIMPMVMRRLCIHINGQRQKQCKG